MLMSAPYLALRASGAAPAGRPPMGGERINARGRVRNSRRLGAFLDMSRQFTYSTSLPTCDTWSFGRGPGNVSTGRVGRNVGQRRSVAVRPMKRQPVIAG